MQGPFQGKNFATTVSPWLVTPEALKPFETALPSRISPELGYLNDEAINRALDINLSVEVKTESKCAERHLRRVADNPEQLKARLLPATSMRRTFTGACLSYWCTRPCRDALLRQAISLQREHAPARRRYVSPSVYRRYHTNSCENRTLSEVLSKAQRAGVSRGPCLPASRGRSSRTVGGLPSIRSSWLMHATIRRYCCYARAMQQGRSQSRFRRM